MTDSALSFHPDPRRPAFRAPAGACDAHCHVFGPAARFPFAPGRAYTPVDAPKETLFALRRHLGLERTVLVQASCHGTDNAAMLDMIAAGEGTCRGVAMVEPSIDEAGLRALHEGGVRGVRVNFVKHLGGQAAREKLEVLAPRVAALGWHVVVHFDVEQTEEVAAILEALPHIFVIDHMGRPAASDGVDQPDFQRLLRLLDSERVWVKVSGADRVTRAGPPYDDVVAFGRALVERFPERVLWGTDWPHPNARPPMPDDGELTDFVPRIAETEAQQQALLVDNPTRLYWTD